MFDHFGLLGTRFETSLAFFEAFLAPLGRAIRKRLPAHGDIIFCGEAEFPFFFLGSARGGYDAAHLLDLDGNNIEAEIRE